MSQFFQAPKEHKIIGSIQGMAKGIASFFQSSISDPVQKFATLSNILTIGFLILFFITALLYLYPGFLGQREGFTTIAVDPTYHPKCFARDAEAQRLLAEVVNSVPNTPEGIQWVDEFRLILTKLLCIDADITGSGSGVYSTMSLQFNTFHDMEPVANFVGRCLNRSLRERDVSLTLKKLETRGSELIMGTPGVDKAQKQLWVGALHNIATRTSQAIHKVCLVPAANMDRPAGVRDPGYNDDSTELSKPAPYQETGNITHL
jgi:hypothetical protein